MAETSAKHRKHNEIAEDVRIDGPQDIEPPIRLDRWVKVNRRCAIGRYSYVSSHTELAQGTQIGRYCSIARHCEIGAAAHPTDWLSTHPFQYTDLHFKKHPGYRDVKFAPRKRGAPTRIGHDVWIGSHAVILRGVQIGSGAIIAAGAVVTKDIPPYHIAKGLGPASITPRHDPETIQRLLAVAWWDLDFAQISDLPFDDLPAALERLEAIRAGQT